MIFFLVPSLAASSCVACWPLWVPFWRFCPFDAAGSEPVTQACLSVCQGYLPLWSSLYWVAPSACGASVTQFACRLF